MQENPRTQPLTISVEEAAKILGIGRSLAYDLASRGQLPGVIRLGRRLLVSRPVLEQRLGICRGEMDTNAVGGGDQDAGGDN